MKRAVYKSPENRVQPVARALSGGRGAGRLGHVSGASGPEAVAQRKLITFKTPKLPLSADKANIINDAKALNTATETAYQNTWKRLSDSVKPVGAVALNHANFPGVSAGNFATFIIRVAGINDSLKATATGYVIEDQVTAAKPAAATSQVVSGSARPDFVITHGADKGIVDITSSKQTGHVLNKRFPKSSYCYISEAIYPSIDFATLGGVMPALAGAAAALAKNAQKVNANNHVHSKLSQIKRSLDNYKTGIMQDDDDFAAKAKLVVKGINKLPKRAWSPGDVVKVNRRIAAVNALLGADFKIKNLTFIIQSARLNYLLTGNPLWS